MISMWNKSIVYLRFKSIFLHGIFPRETTKDKACDGSINGNSGTYEANCQ